jgi:hypothetical protein
VKERERKRKREREREREREGEREGERERGAYQCRLKRSESFLVQPHAVIAAPYER